jgi:hypothetical protein
MSLRVSRLLFGLALALIVASSAVIPRYFAKHHAVLPGVDGCRTLGIQIDRVACYTERMPVEIGNESPLSYLRSIDHRKQSKSFMNDCHQVGHNLAGKYFESDRRTVTNLISQSDHMGSIGLCEQGFVHGFLERSVAANPRRFDAIASTFCGSMTTVRAQSQCVHGLGHGAWAANHDIAMGRERCMSLKSLRGSCMNGLYMQREVDQGVGKSSSMRTKCEGTPPADAFLCYKYAAQSLQLRTEVSPPNFLQRCSHDALTGDAMLGCVTSVLALDEKSVGLCDTLTGTPLEYCAYFAIIHSIRAPRTGWIDKYCAPVDGRLGCAAGVGFVSAAGEPIGSDTSRLEACASQQQALRLACSAGAGSCWPTLTITDAPPEPRCSRMRTALTTNGLN